MNSANVDADADVGGGARDLAGLLDQRRRAMRAHVMGHHGSRARPRGASESGQRAKIGIDRRHRGKPQQPGLQRLAGAAERGRRQRPRMIMRID